MNTGVVRANPLAADLAAGAPFIRDHIIRVTEKASDDFAGAASDGGGQRAFIGAVRRMAARLDDHYSLVAGALSSTPD